MHISYLLIPFNYESSLENVCRFEIYVLTIKIMIVFKEMMKNMPQLCSKY